MASRKNRRPPIATGVLGWLLRGAPCGAVPPKKAPEELLCFFGTRDVSRRTAIANCHGARDLKSKRRWVTLDAIVAASNDSGGELWTQGDHLHC